ncbi:MAG: diaminopimelate epimerase [Verrucomicrobiota bacterium]
MDFWKMNGAGNDFVVIDNRDQSLNLSKEQIANLCHRQRGIGADGLLAVEPAQNGADFRMRYYNADGGEAEMCGNGARCFANFIRKITEENLESTSFETIAGVIQARFPGELVEIGLSEPFDLQLNQELLVGSERMTIHSVNTGVPHALAFVDDLENADIVGNGRAIREHTHFAPAGTNANLVQVLGENRIAIRTYERGVEDETLACGTGMVAAAIIHFELSNAPTPIEVTVRGGDTLKVDFEKEGESFHHVKLTGPADFVYAGRIEVI